MGQELCGNGEALVRVCALEAMVPLSRHLASAPHKDEVQSLADSVCSTSLAALRDTSLAVRVAGMPSSLG